MTTKKSPTSAVKPDAAAENAGAAELTNGTGESSTLEASGAIIEDAAKAEVDLTHPAVDANPRAGSPKHSSSIQFNDPALSQREAVKRQLAADD